MLVKSSDLAGEALVPYYRQLLPIFNLYRNHNINIGDHIDYGQRKKKNLGDLIQETLEIMEMRQKKRAQVDNYTTKKISQVMQSDL